MSVLAVAHPSYSLFIPLLLFSPSKAQRHKLKQGHIGCRSHEAVLGDGNPVDYFDSPLRLDMRPN